MFRIDPAGCVRIALLLYATSFGASSLAQRKSAGEVEVNDPRGMAEGCEGTSGRTVWSHRWDT